MKQKQSNDNVISMRMPGQMMEAVKEMKHFFNFTDKTDAHTVVSYIEMIMKQAIKGNISQRQIDTYSKDTSSLFVMYSKACRGVEGFGFTTKQKKTRFVYAPEARSVSTKGVFGAGYYGSGSYGQ